MYLAESCVEKSGISKVLGLGALLMILDIATDILSVSLRLPSPPSKICVCQVRTLMIF